ncbi:hypothetical protein [Bradyrhizobium sp. AZCC 2289]|uniref:hypothetical protein n=1 Tax=Bradyrhizobium sp. AZCC 2289 TaxID=3117026 RepID=UPI002FF36A0C
MSDIILKDKILSSSAYSHVIAVPQAKIDIAHWLLKLAEPKYRRCCPPDHISCGSTFTDDGTRMSINVEMIGRTVTLQHYIAETATAHLCRMISTSDGFTQNGRTRVQIIWTLSVKPRRRHSLRMTNSVVAHPTAAFTDFIAARNTSFEPAADAGQRGGEHNRRDKHRAPGVGSAKSSPQLNSMAGPRASNAPGRCETYRGSDDRGLWTTAWWAISSRERASDR